jgi:hypothetical protein
MASEALTNEKKYCRLALEENQRRLNWARFDLKTAEQKVAYALSRVQRSKRRAYLLGMKDEELR